MNCFYHPDRESVYQCVHCGKPLCQECALNHDGKPICKDCLNLVNPVNNRPSYNGFLAFVFSLIPGAAQMYFGLMKRGLQIMLVFFLIIVLGNSLSGLGFINVFSFVVWFYSLFDSYHIKKKIDKHEHVEDTKVFQYDLNKVNKYYLGIILIILGCYSLISEVSYRFRMSLVLPILFIIVGVYMLIKSKQNLQTKNTEQNLNDQNNDSEQNYVNSNSIIIPENNNKPGEQ